MYPVAKERWVERYGVLHLMNEKHDGVILQCTKCKVMSESAWGVDRSSVQGRWVQFCASPIAQQRPSHVSAEP